MTYKDMAALLGICAVSGILASAPAMASSPQPLSPQAMPPMDLSVAAASPVQLVELAGADTGDKATDEQLKKAGQDMVPADNMKKATHSAQPTTQPAPEPMPMKAADDKEKMPAKSMPAKETKPEAPAKPDAMMAVAPSAGFYIRGDVGYGFAVDPDGSTSAGAMTGESVDNAALVGGGIGYRFGNGLRTDMTFDFRSDADVEATTAGGTAVTSEVNGWTMMVNGYWDVQGMEMVTPYLGAGIGYSRLETTNQTGGNAETGDTSSNLAWAMMLGATVDVGMADAVLDLGYRYIHLGDFNQNGGASYDDLMAHEVRLGLRYNF